MNSNAANRLIEAMKLEIDRSMAHLKSPGHPRPYFISYLLRDIQRYEVWARYGSIFQDSDSHKRNCYADIRVGSYRYDQVSSGGLTDNQEDSDSFDLIELPLENDPDALRFCLWRLTDAKYREAVTRYHARKSREISYLDESRSFPSFTKIQAETRKKRLKSFQLDKTHWRKFVKKASLFIKRFPEIKNSYCEFQAEMVTKVFVSSEGTIKTWQEPLYHLSAYMWFHTKKTNQDLSHVCQTRSLGELPDLKQFLKQVESKIQSLYELDKGEEMSSFNGPVLLAPKPAGLFIHEVVGHRLEANRLLSDREGRTFKDKLNQAIMHPDISIHDDPSLKEFKGQSLTGSYDFDDEGIASQSVTLVEKGKLKDFLTTRMPSRKKAHKSNGHARCHQHERPISRMGNLFIESHSNYSFAELKELLLQEIKRRKLKFGMILLEVEGGETETEAYDFQAFLGEINLAVKVYASGKEVFVRGVDFVGTPLGSLSNIIAVGNDYEVDNSYCGAESGTISVSTISPSILLSNLELQVKDPSKVTQYTLSLPWISQEKAKVKAKR